MSDVEENRRPFLNRIGIVLLNIAAPGLGLLRVQRLRAAITLLLVPHILLGLLIAYFALAPTLSFWGWLGAALAMVALLLVAYTFGMTLSWRASRPRQAPGPWWSRWYGIVGTFALGVAVAWVPTDIALSHYRLFYVPSVSMVPTLAAGDRFLASMRGPGELRRGDLVLIESNHRGAIYISRIAALPGDRIALVDGRVILNGRPVQQREIGREALPRELVPGVSHMATRLAEQFPGEPAPHQIYDTGFSSGDDFQEIGVRPGHVFALGDNRDNAADSRFDSTGMEMGLGMVPIDRIRGRPLYHSWGSSRPMGTPLGRQ